MGQAKNRKAEIEQLKAEGVGKKCGILFAYKPKDFKTGDVYPTFALTVARSDLKKIKADVYKVGFAKADLYGAPKQFFKKYMDRLGDTATLELPEVKQYANTLVAYAMTFQSWDMLMSQGDRGCVITVREWDEGNPNGAQHGGNRYAFDVPYEFWAEQVKEVQADPEKIVKMFKPLFSDNAVERMMSSFETA